MALQKGGRKRDGAAEDKETRATFSKKFVAAESPKACACVCPASHKGWGFWMLRRHQSQFKSCIRGCDSCRHTHISVVDTLCFL